MRLLLTLVCSTGMVASAGYVSGATITVTTTEPGISADGLCSFAEAVDNVNGGDVHSDCEAGSDGLNIIELGQGETYLQRPEDDIDLFEAFVIINGNGSTFDAMDQEDGWGTILFGVGVAIINDLTIKGSHDSLGAILMLGGRLSLNRCIIRDNAFGGLQQYDAGIVVVTDSAFLSNYYGIANSSEETTLIAINTDFVGNHYAISGRDGSATLIGCNVEDSYVGLNAHSVDIRHSTIINNGVGVSARSGSISHSAVVGNYYGVVLPDAYNSNSYEFSVVSSTISGNTFGIFGDTDYPWQGIVYIRDSTITGNRNVNPSYFGGGLVYLLDQYVIKNSIIGSNQTNCAGGYGGSGSPQSRGFNLTDDDSCHLNHATDMVVSDVMLSELGDWGGSTPTHMPLEGSPAIDMVKWAGQCSPRDQRGYLRPVDGDGNGVAHCDCGAVEYGAEPPPRPLDPGVTTSEVE